MTRPPLLLLLAWLLSPAPGLAAAGCGFDATQLTFAGTPKAQATCLLRPVRIGGVLGPLPAGLPPVLDARIGTPMTIPRPALRQYLATRNLTEAALGGSLDAPLSRARNNTPTAPVARYFVIHDTSTPNLGNAPFPADLDGNIPINRLAGFANGSNAAAHLFVNRRGETLLGHDFGVPWRATKLETKIVGVPAKGLFIHVELTQPRRRDPAVANPQNDRLAPDPGFSAAQYDRLALAYVLASHRAGQWMIPAFHAAIDDGLQDGHDDPQRFDLDAFDTALGAILNALP